MKTEFILGYHLPPGFRFHPSDEELIEHYLLNQLNSRPLPANLIAEIELYNYNPWELPKKALFGENEWYFFSPRDRKYPNGARPNRATSMGFWKATGTDKPILTSFGLRRIGVKKNLVFYMGSPPNGVKTDWIMNEYRLPDMMIRPTRLKGSMRLDDWVLCRVRQKGNTSKKRPEEAQGSPTKCMPTKNVEDHQIPFQYTNSYANISFTKDCLFKDCHHLASMLNGQNLPPIQPFSSTSIPFRSIKDEDLFNQNQSQGEIFEFDTTNDVTDLHEFDAAGQFLQ